MTAVWCVALALLTLSSAIASSPRRTPHTELPTHLQRLRSLDTLPQPTSLHAAKALHAEANARTQRIMQHFGHSPPAPNAPVGYPPLLVSDATTSILRPTDFGADPTGTKDSSQAFASAMAKLLSQRGDRKAMASNITDLGGATLDLSGGTYLISAPIVIPPGFGNAQIVRGTLRAAPTFPPDRWLVEIGSASCAPTLPNGNPDGQGSCNEFINLSEMMFDAMHVAAGGVRVAKVMGTTLGPSVFFTGFNAVGVRIDNGHEVMLSEAWLAECYWSANGPCAKKADSIAVQINGNDHYLTDVIVFDYAHTGVEVNGAANVLQAVCTLPHPPKQPCARACLGLTARSTRGRMWIGPHVERGWHRDQGHRASDPSARLLPRLQFPSGGGPIRPHCHGVLFLGDPCKLHLFQQEGNRWRLLRRERLRHLRRFHLD